jgi:hypothetical protein
MDILGINSFRNAFLLNMAISEGFIDSAQLFSDVKSHAKELGYTPRSSVSAVANVTVSFSATGASQPYIIPKGSTFSAHVKNQNFTFSLAEPIIVASPNTQFSFTTNIYEGVYVKDSYVFNQATNRLPSFAITNANVDTSSIVVNVFGNNSLIGQNYNLATSLLDLDGTSQVYFLQCATANGNYEIIFGDGIIGNQPLNGSLVILDYRVTSGAQADGSSAFNINFDPTGVNEITSSVTIVTNSIAAGGVDAEDIETTRFYAPRWFQVQERAIVPSDYEVLLKNKFPELNAVNAYGGETLNPPQFGKVVIAVDIAGVAGLPQSKGQQYSAFIKGRNPLSIQPIFTAAQHLYLKVTSLIKYNVNVSLESEATIRAIVTDAITKFNSQFLDDFAITFYFSQFSQALNNSDPSIVSNETSIQLYQKIQPSANPQTYMFFFSVPLVNNVPPLPSFHSFGLMKTLTSTSFVYKGLLSYLEDDGNGLVRIVSLKGNTLTTTTDIGIIDYNRGFVVLFSFSVDSFDGNDLLVLVTPQETDISATQDLILSIEPDKTQLSVEMLSL